MTEPEELAAPAGGTGGADAGLGRERKLAAVLALVAAALGIYSIFFSSFGRLKSVEYKELYVLLPDKVSQSAALVVRLPEGAQDGKVDFEPAIQGSWTASGPGTKTFQPAQKLELGKYYTVALATDAGTLKKDFQAVDDPKVVSILPAADSPANEFSDITITFNRPMVPLTSLDGTAESAARLVEVTPRTEGRFKWLTTRTLQFIPAAHLQRSAHYSVQVRSGFRSVEGLSVPEAHYEFTTRPLRYDQLTPSGPLLYDQPFRMFFNQPVDLERTKGEIKVLKLLAGPDGPAKNVPFTVSYGTRVTVVNGKEQKVTDRGIVEIWNAKDRFGRERFWDFNTNYSVSIQRAYPLEGDINLAESRSGNFRVGELVQGMSADSPRSQQVFPDVFDPQGKLWLAFPENIDKSRSVITADHLKEVGYGEKCEENTWGPDCPKTQDRTRLYLAFDPAGLSPGQELHIELRRVVNEQGLQLNPETIRKSALVYPPLRILKTVPAPGELADPDQVTLCSNSPLSAATEDDFNERFQSSLPIGRWNWWPARRVTEPNDPSRCDQGQFASIIRVGLAPERDISLTLRPADDFGQQTELKLGFRTRKVSELSRNFYQLQQAYNVTSPDRTKLTFAVENLDSMDLDICQVSPEQMLRYLQKMPDATVAPGSLSCTARYSRHIPLPERYWTRNYFQVKLADYVPDPLGHYVLTFSNPDYHRVSQAYDPASRRTVTKIGGLVYQKAFLTVTNLAVQEKRVEWQGGDYDAHPEIVRQDLATNPRSLYWVSRFGTLDPVQGAAVKLYNDDFAEVSSGVTDGQGVAQLKVAPKVRGAVVTAGADSAVVAAGVDTLQWSADARSADRYYIYTDRPIYRPGQKVYIKGIHRIGYDGSYQALPGAQVDLTVYDSRGAAVQKQKATLGDYGTFTAELTLDAKAPLGTYSISTKNGGGSFDVEEYRPAAFQLDVKPDKEEYVAGDTMKLALDAHYYFGVQLEGGTVEYSILSQDYYFDRFQGKDWFNFSGTGYDYWSGGYNDKFLKRGKLDLDASGRGVVAEKLDFDQFFKPDQGQNSKIFVVNITARNKNGQSVSSRRSFIVHRGEIYVGVSLDKTFAGKGEKIKARAKTVDVKGAPRGVSGVDIAVNKVTWSYFKRREVDGRFYYQSEKKTETVARARIGTNGDGDGSWEFSVNKEGEYEVVLTAADGRGNTVRTLQNLYIYGAAQVEVRPVNNATLDLVTAKTKVDVGEKVSVIIKSPFPKAKALVSIERGKVLDYSIIDVGSNLQKYDFTVKESYLPNVYFSVLLLSPRPDVKFGEIQYQVNTDRAGLQVEVATDKKAYLPGEKVTLSLSSKDWQGRGVPAELSVAVVDMSVLALKGNPKKDPLVFFYDGLPLTVVTASNIKNVLYEAEIPAGTKGGSGGGAPADLAKKKRGEFKDTALWAGSVHTDGAGRATLAFTLPDNLTTWQIESLGVSKDTKLGVGYKEITARKELMVVPLYPRFVVPGDKFSVGGKVFNQSDRPQSVDLSFGSDTLKPEGPGTAAVRLAPGQTATIYFDTDAPRGPAAAHSFTLSAKADGLEDTVEAAIPVTPDTTYETTATAGYTTDTRATEYVLVPSAAVTGRGGVTVNAGATLAVFVSEGLRSLLAYPSDSTWDTASKLAAIAVVKRGLHLPNVGDAFQLGPVEFDGKQYSVDQVVDLGLARMYQNQAGDGGFAYYQGMRPSYYLTLEALRSLLALDAAGYPVQDQAIQKGAAYIYKNLTSDQSIYSNRKLVIHSAYVLSGVPGYAGNEFLSRKLGEAAADRKFVEEDAPNSTLAELAILSTRGYASGSHEYLFRTLVNRVQTDARGAYLAYGLGGGSPYSYSDSAVLNTALLLKAYAADRRDSQDLPNVLRWLLRSRSKDGAWLSPQDTLAVVDAMTDFLSWKRETQSQFDLALSMDGAEKASFSFGPKTILRNFSRFLPTSDFSAGTLHALTLEKRNASPLPNAFYYDIDFRYYLPTENIVPRDEGFAVTRAFYREDDTDLRTPVTSAKPGEVLRGRLTITVPEWRNLVAVEDVIPAGMEIVNLSLATEDQSLLQDGGFKGYEAYYQENGGAGAPAAVAAYVPSGGTLGWLREKLTSFFSVGGRRNATPVETEDEFYRQAIPSMNLYPDNADLRDDRLQLFKERVAPGVYTYDYYVRALVPGTYNHLPATVLESNFPENFGRTGGEMFTVTR